MMGVFDEAHQRTIDEINDDGWHYIARRADDIAEAFGGGCAVSSDTIHLKAGLVHAMVEQGGPCIEWNLPGNLSLPYKERLAFTEGFRISVDAATESRSNVVVCRPFDWYMLCRSLQIGLSMASVGVATCKNDY